MEQPVSQRASEGAAGTGSAPAASVIVPFYNAADTLPACLDALAGQECARPIEILMVDNDSTDESAAIVAEFARNHPEVDVRLLSERTRGPAAARNTGVRSARSGLLLFTDADCIPSPSWVREMLGHFERHPEIGAVSGSIRPRISDEGGSVERFACLYTLPPHRREERHTRYTLVTGGFQTANLGVPRSVFERVGGFDESLFPGEDHDLCRKIYGLGLSILAVPDAVVEHRHRSTLRGMLRQAYGYGRIHGAALRRFVPGACIISLPWAGYVCRRVGPEVRGRVWIDLNQADKKLAVLVVLAALHPVLGILLPLYFLRLAFSAWRRGRVLGVPFRVRDVAAAPVLMVLKSAALTLGRLRGAFSERVVCF